MSDRCAVWCGLALAALSATETSGQDGYRRPPKAVTDILDAAAPPTVSVSPTGEHLLLVKSDRYPPIADLAEPTLRLAGLRINPRTNGPARALRVAGIAVMPLATAKAKDLELPPGKLGAPVWSPRGNLFAVAATTDQGIGLHVYGVAAAAPRSLGSFRVNAAIGESYQWMPDGESLMVLTVPKDRGQPPPQPVAPAGPVIQQSEGKAAPVRTYPDLLQNAHDEALFEYHATSQLAIVSEKGLSPLGSPGIIASSDPSPDGQYVLVTRLNRPYSYLLPYSSFPRVTEVWDRSGKVVQTVADLPLRDKVPIEGVPTGPRSVRWIPTLPHSLLWVEALDDGDPRKKVPHRDALYTQSVDGGRATELLKLEQRFHQSVDFFPTGNRLLVRDYDRERKWTRTILASSTALLGEEPRVLFERSSQDRYGDPGTPLTRMLPSGHRVLRTAGDPSGDTIWLDGPGASPTGDRPFLDRFDVKTGKATRVSECGSGVYEDVTAVLNATGSKLLIRRESPNEPPNYFLRDGTHEKKLTDSTDPAPDLRKVKKEIVSTKRADGTVVSFTLHTPPRKDADERLPAVFYAYPVEFASADTAGQVTGSPHSFTAVAGYSHLFFLTQGYAVMEVSMPIVGPPASANDTFLDQLASNGKAAIDKAAEMGVVDPGKVGVMGHSYGAFMTANLLAHSNLFRAGIGRSGAYNRTLTPFGFQNERRTFWEAPQVYSKMSPFFHAEKIKEPLLLIHGAADNNPGTFPIQSERLYQAIRGNGGTCRLVMLPHESHGYEARESVEHVLFEQFAWFEKYVKGK